MKASTAFAWRRAKERGGCDAERPYSGMYRRCRLAGLRTSTSSSLTDGGRKPAPKNKGHSVAVGMTRRYVGVTMALVRCSGVLLLINYLPGCVGQHPHSAASDDCCFFPVFIHSFIHSYMQKSINQSLPECLSSSRVRYVVDAMPFPRLGYHCRNGHARGALLSMPALMIDQQTEKLLCKRQVHV